MCPKVLSMHSTDTEKNLLPVVVGRAYVYIYIYIVRSIWPIVLFKHSVSLWICCLIILSGIKSELFNLSTVIVKLSILSSMLFFFHSYIVYFIFCLFFIFVFVWEGWKRKRERETAPTWSRTYGWIPLPWDHVLSQTQELDINQLPPEGPHKVSFIKDYFVNY